MIYRLFEWKLILQMVGSLRNLFYIIMIIFVPLYKLKSMRSSSVCENLHTYCGMLSPQQDISSRREGLLNCRRPQQAWPSQDRIKCLLTKINQRRARMRSILESGFSSSHHSIISELRALRWDTYTLVATIVTDLLKFFPCPLVALKKKNASPCLLLCRERQRRQVPVSLKARILDRRTVALNAVCGMRCWVNFQEVLGEGRAVTSDLHWKIPCQPSPLLQSGKLVCACACA